MNISLFYLYFSFYYIFLSFFSPFYFSVRSKNSSSSKVSSSFSALSFFTTFIYFSPKIFTLIQSSDFSNISSPSTNLFYNFYFLSRSFYSKPNYLFYLLHSSLSSDYIYSYFLKFVS